MEKTQALNKLKGSYSPIPWDTSEVKEVKLLISMPCFNGLVHLPTDSNIRLATEKSTLGDKLKVSFNYIADSLICRARDKLANQFLNSDAEWQLQIDNDIIFPFGMGHELATYYAKLMDSDIFDLFMNEGVFKAALSINAIDEILRSAIVHNKKIVGGLYFWRGGQRRVGDTASIFTPEAGELKVEFQLKPDNFMYTDKLATGFLLTHRSVYEDIAINNRHLSYDEPSPMTAFYNPMITDEGDKRFYRSEDYAFSYRAKQVGYDPCLNMNILLGHIGTHIYSWFDRPVVQKLMFELHGDKNETIEKRPI